MIYDWSAMDSWIVITAALAGAGCALPGTFLLLRRQSLLGDSLSHSVLPGLVLAYLGLDWLEHAGWMSAEAVQTWRQPALFLGAGGTAIVSGTLSEFLARRVQLDPGASLGVVYTAMFALGILLIRLAADSAHIDPGCVLYGNLETVVLDTWGTTGIPHAVFINGGIVAGNLLLLGLFYKELQLCTFDPELARALGLPVTVIQHLLMACTVATIVAAFESVGSILVIAMLVIPPASSVLLSDRLPRVLIFAVVLAVLAAILGHVGALVLPTPIRWLLQWPELGDISTSGMLTVASGGLFLLCWLFSPGHGIARQWSDHLRLQRRILAEDVLGALYRMEELLPASDGKRRRETDLAAVLRTSLPRLRRCFRRLASRGDLELTPTGVELTDAGRARAQNLVRSHRLWESYLAQHFQLAAPRLHESAERIEHFLSPDLREELAAELLQPGRDPHGATIPPAGSAENRPAT